MTITNKGFIKNGASYGTKIGNLQAFTIWGAIEKYQTASRVAYANLTPATCAMLERFAEDMQALGFPVSYLEELEIEVIKQ